MRSTIMKTYRLNSIALGVALLLAGVGTSRAEPSPDLMNSIHRLRVEAQKNARADAAAFKPGSASVAYWSWTHTRQITAGQSTVAVPDLSHRVLAEGTASDFKTAPLQQPSSKPKIK
jgi:hypothetical protein